MYSSRTSVPGHFGATIITVKSSRIFIPSSTILNPWEYDSVAPFFIKGITSLTTGEWFLSGVKFITISAVGINSLYVPTLKSFFVAFKYEGLLFSIAEFLSAYEIVSPESRIFNP